MDVVRLYERALGRRAKITHVPLAIDHGEPFDVARFGIGLTLLET